MAKTLPPVPPTVAQGAPAHSTTQQLAPPLKRNVAPAAPATAQTTRGIKVRATQMGYYDHARRRDGDVFLIKDAQAFSSRWMEYVDAKTPEQVTTGREELRKKHDEILRDRMPAQGTQFAQDDVDNPLKA
jgi:hypothetical protein